MGGAHVVCCVQGKKGSALGGGFYGCATLCLFALDEAGYGDHFHSGFACGFNGCDCRCARGADVVDDEYGRFFLKEAFDASSGAVRFFCFTDEESVDERCAVMLLGVPCAGGRYIGDDGIGAHR